jgi:hypothetical protein
MKENLETSNGKRVMPIKMDGKTNNRENEKKARRNSTKSEGNRMPWNGIELN